MVVGRVRFELPVGGERLFAVLALELVLLGDILTEYDFKQHVASDVGLNQKFLDSNGCKMQQKLDTIAKWTDDNF